MDNRYLIDIINQSKDVLYNHFGLNINYSNYIISYEKYYNGYPIYDFIDDQGNKVKLSSITHDESDYKTEICFHEKAFFEYSLSCEFLFDRVQNRIDFYYKSGDFEINFNYNNKCVKIFFRINDYNGFTYFICHYDKNDNCFNYNGVPFICNVFDDKNTLIKYEFKYNNRNAHNEFVLMLLEDTEKYINLNEKIEKWIEYNNIPVDFYGNIFYDNDLSYFKLKFT